MLRNNDNKKNNLEQQKCDENMKNDNSSLGGNAKKKFYEEVKAQFFKGWATLIGWTLPVAIFVFIINCIGSYTWNNKLDIEKMKFTPSNNMVLISDENSIYRTIMDKDGGKGSTFSFNYKTVFEGHGKIESADVFYSYKTREP